jgi:hypothetical protein
MRVTANSLDTDGNAATFTRLGPDATVRVSLHRITADDIGHHGLLYTAPNDARRIVNTQGQIVVKIGDATLYFTDTTAVRRLADYLTVAAHTADSTQEVTR